jgi:hypothetical protein
MHSPSKIALLSLTGLLLSGVAVLPTALGSFAEGQPLAMTTSSIAPPTKMPVVTKESITFGAYDPHGDLAASICARSPWPTIMRKRVAAPC